nr:GntR family transcriptional regulator [uncultured Dyadobacter sp.]
MRKINFENHFTVDRNSSEPVYQQLVEAVLNATKTGLIDRGDRLPSINELSRHYSVSRSTIEKSYNNLRDMGILSSQHGKSFFINRLNPAQEWKVLVLFNQLNEYNKVICDALTERLGRRADVDLHIYYNSAVHFRQLIRKKLAGYSHIIVIPHFLDEPETGYQAIERLPAEKLILLDRPVPGLSGSMGTVGVHFAVSLRHALNDLATALRKYQCTNLICPEHAFVPPQFRETFVHFCEENNLVYRVSGHIPAGSISTGEAYIVFSDEHLMFLVREVAQSDLLPGKHIGIVSFHDNDAKKDMLNGITTISPDFKAMGNAAADMVLNGHMQRIDHSCRVVVRASL